MGKEKWRFVDSLSVYVGCFLLFIAILLLYVAVSNFGTITQAAKDNPEKLMSELRTVICVGIPLLLLLVLSVFLSVGIDGVSGYELIKRRLKKKK